MSDVFRRITRSGASSAVNELSGNNFAANVLTTINDFYKDKIFCDIVITNGSCRIKAHKIILAANSQIFQIFLQHNQECSIFAVSDDLSEKSLEVLLSYMYTGVLVLRDPSQAVLLLQDALCLEISSLVTILQNYLRNHNIKLNKDQVRDHADFAGIKVENKKQSRSSIISDKEQAWKRILNDMNGKEATESIKKQKRDEITTFQSNLRNFDSKFEMESGKPRACEMCKESFKSHHVLRYHKMHAHKMPSHLSSSKVAAKALLKRSRFMKVKMLLQKSSFCELTRAHNCPKCLMVFKSKYLFMRHTSLHLRSFLHTATNFKRKNAKKSLNIATNSQNFTSEEKSQCTHCNVILSNERLLMDHMITHHPNVTFSCHHCSFSTRLQHVLERHQLENHRKRTTCPICGKSCARTESLNVHMLLIHKVHNSKIANKLHKCKEPGCGYVCLYKKRVEEHALKHKDTKQHKCNICSKMFKHEKGLQRHKMVIHDGVRPFICDICGQAYGQEGELKVHIARHTSNKPHACHLCPYTTQYKANLQSHLFKIHQVMMNQKMLVFSCDQCPYITTRRSRFNDHIKKTHKNIVDIPCPICNKMFSTKQNLYGHMTSVHKPKTFQCSYCSYSTGVSTTLKQHVKVMHTQRDVKNYECSLCGFRSATSGNCRKHIRRLHMNQQLDPKFVGPMSDNILLSNSDT